MSARSFGDLTDNLSINQLDIEELVSNWGNDYQVNDLTNVLKNWERPMINISWTDSTSTPQNKNILTSQDISIAEINDAIGGEGLPSKFNITQVSFGNDCKDIENNIFESVQNLVSVNLGGLETISTKAFRNTRITTVDLSNVTSISSIAFADNNALLTVTGLENNTNITNFAQYMFSGCGNLQSIDLRNFTSLSNGWVFKNCTNLKTVNDTQNITSIGSSVFEHCNSLVSVDLSNVTSLDQRVFCDCFDLTSIGGFSNSITTIPRFAFTNCRSLTTLTIPTNINSIGKWAFNGCISLQTVIFEGGGEVSNLNFDSQNGSADSLVPDLKNSNGESIPWDGVLVRSGGTQTFN